MERCKDCYHSETEQVMENNIALGIVLGTMFWPQYKEVLKCKNRNSPYYYVEVDNNFSCSKYEK